MIKNNRVLRYALIILALLILLFAVLFYDDVERRVYPRRYSLYVQTYAREYDLPPELIYAVIRTESDFRPSAVSSAGAMGLMQLMPSTFRWLTEDKLKEHLPDLMLYDPATNIRYGAYYLRMMYDRYGRWPEAFAAYNAGPGTVDGWLEQEALTDEHGLLLPDEIPIGQTRAYVAEIERTWATYARLYPAKEN